MTDRQAADAALLPVSTSKLHPTAGEFLALLGLFAEPVELPESCRLPATAHGRELPAAHAPGNGRSQALPPR